MAILTSFIVTPASLFWQCQEAEKKKQNKKNFLLLLADMIKSKILCYNKKFVLFLMLFQVYIGLMLVVLENDFFSRDIFFDACGCDSKEM